MWNSQRTARSKRHIRWVQYATRWIFLQKVIHPAEMEDIPFHSTRTEWDCKCFYVLSTLSQFRLCIWWQQDDPAAWHFRDQCLQWLSGQETTSRGRDWADLWSGSQDGLSLCVHTTGTSFIQVYPHLCCSPTTWPTSWKHDTYCI